jgi:hypothetical protein
MVSRPVYPGASHHLEQQPIFPSLHGYYLEIFAFFLYGAPSLTKGLLSNLLVKVLLGLASTVTLEFKSRRTKDLILLSHLRLGPLSVVAYDSQGYYGGSILNRLHTGY